MHLLGRGPVTVKVGGGQLPDRFVVRAAATGIAGRACAAGSPEREAHPWSPRACEPGLTAGSAAFAARRALPAASPWTPIADRGGIDAQLLGDLGHRQPGILGFLWFVRVRHSGSSSGIAPSQRTRLRYRCPRRRRSCRRRASPRSCSSRTSFSRRRWWHARAAADSRSGCRAAGGAEDRGLLDEPPRGDPDGADRGRARFALGRRSSTRRSRAARHGDRGPPVLDDWVGWSEPALHWSAQQLGHGPSAIVDAGA